MNEFIKEALALACFKKKGEKLLLPQDCGSCLEASSRSQAVADPLVHMMGDKFLFKYLSFFFK